MTSQLLGKYDVTTLTTFEEFIAKANTLLKHLISLFYRAIFSDW